MLKTALAYLAAGRSVVPIAPGRKAPSAVDPKTGRRRLIRWERYQHAHATPAEVRRWFAGQHPIGLGIIAGAVSGVTLPDGTRAGLEFLVVRSAALDRQFVSRLAAHGGLPLLERLPCEQTPAGGRQYGYLCIEWSTSTILARRYAGTMPDSRRRTAALIETRGEGDLCVVAPTPVGTHPTHPEQDSAMMRGSWTHIPVITPEARRLLWTCARALDTSSASARPRPRRRGVRHPPPVPIPMDRHQRKRRPRPGRAPGPKPDETLTAAPSPVPGGTVRGEERRQLRDELVAFLGRWHWEWFVTLTFRRMVHPEAADRRFREFIKRLNRAIYGPRWHEQGRGIHWVRAMEYQPQRGVIHFHALFADASGLQPCDAIKLWRRLAGRAIIEPIRNLTAAPHYLLKDVPKEGELDFGSPRRRGKHLPHPEP